jgi:hypothetical protein
VKGGGKLDLIVPALSVSGLEGIHDYNFDEDGNANYNLFFNPYATNNDKLTYGEVRLYHDGSGKARIMPNQYDFNEKSWMTPNPARWLRNIGTVAGEIYCIGSTGGFPKDYTVYFAGTIDVEMD